uniref:Uncharacterized protein n=1 Tax=Anguilla anguilla TaxID=7936 RepID=A0A0E9UZI8_ANGAN
MLAKCTGQINLISFDLIYSILQGKEKQNNI